MDNQQSIPGRASDAGPDETQTPLDRQASFSLLVEEAMEDVHELSRCYRDSREDERIARLRLTFRILDAVQRIQEVA